MDNDYDKEVARLAYIGAKGDSENAMRQQNAMYWVPAMFLGAVGLVAIFGTLEVLFALVNWAVNG